MGNLEQKSVFDREVNLVQLYGGQQEVDPHRLLTQLSDISRRMNNDVYTITTDMDGTMVDTDLGTATLLRLMLDDRFYTKGGYDFEKNLLSPDFTEGYKYAAKNSIGFKIGSINSGIYIDDASELSAWVLEKLCPEIIDLYRTIQFRIRLFGNNSEDIDKLKKKLMSLFDMLDLLTMKLEPIFREGTKGGIIPKTRLFAGFAEKEILESVAGMFTDSMDDEKNTIVMNESDLEIFNSAPGLYIPEEIRKRPISLRVNKVTDVRRLLRMAVELNSKDVDKSNFESNTMGGAVHIVTTNWPAIARFLALNQPYNKVLKTQQANFPQTRIEQFIHGTRLRVSNTGTVLPVLDGSAVLAERKREIAVTHESILALGDTRTDELMGATAIENNGFFIAVGRDIEVTARTYHELAKMIGPESASRILFIQANDTVRY
jgi:hypothetical protein